MFTSLSCTRGRSLWGYTSPTTPPLTTREGGRGGGGGRGGRGGGGEGREGGGGGSHNVGRMNACIYMYMLECVSYTMYIHVCVHVQQLVKSMYTYVAISS